MKEINEKEFARLLKTAKVSFGLKFYGHSNRMTLQGKWDGKDIEPVRLSDEQMVLLFQLVHRMKETLTSEMVRRDLVSDEVKRAYKEHRKAAIEKKEKEEQA